MIWPDSVCHFRAYLPKRFVEVLRLFGRQQRAELRDIRVDFLERLVPLGNILILEDYRDIVFREGWEANGTIDFVFCHHLVHGREGRVHLESDLVDALTESCDTRRLDRGATDRPQDRQDRGDWDNSGDRPSKKQVPYSS